MSSLLTHVHSAAYGGHQVPPWTCVTLAYLAHELGRDPAELAALEVPIRHDTDGQEVFDLDDLDQAAETTSTTERGRFEKLVEAAFEDDFQQFHPRLFENPAVAATAREMGYRVPTE
ncbi:hypothetical protein [Actinopolyspora halophila]|uniref:hypothetical protein n=1 Tax=Actinopolyspora halophila TaxID=1850 RepID=UPI000369CBC4|nr:hypothetical protein [Actinopolyspora halophila]